MYTYNKTISLAKAKTDRYFEFSNKKSLDGISFFDYDPSQVSRFKDKYNFDKVIDKIKRDKNFSIRLVGR
ncbi:MAG TPA: hypothetical protein VKR53_15045 [Puia sp.]|nr:hypothetical protein [Puia sp.]